MKTLGIWVAPTALVLFGLVASSAFAQSSYNPGSSCTATGEQRQHSQAGASTIDPASRLAVRSVPVGFPDSRLSFKPFPPQWLPAIRFGSTSDCSKDLLPIGHCCP